MQRPPALLGSGWASAGSNGSWPAAASRSRVRAAITVGSSAASAEPGTASRRARAADRCEAANRAASYAKLCPGSDRASPGFERVVAGGDEPVRSAYRRVYGATLAESLLMAKQGWLGTANR